MQRKITAVLQRKSLYVSILLHVLLLLSFSLVLIPQPLITKRPGLYIPAYVYQKSTSTKKEQQQPQPPREVKNNRTDESSDMKGIPISKSKPQQFTAISSHDKSDPIHLIGDKKVDNKLLKILGKALTAKLLYPKIAIDFRVRGTVLVGMVLHPDGSITDTKLVESSKVEVLDNAALAAVNATSLPDISTYLNKPKFIVIGIIFR